MNARSRMGRGLAVVHLVLASSLAAQTPEQLRAVEPRPFAVTDWGGALGFEFYYREEEQISDDGSDFSRRLTRFEEYIELTGEGFVYHPLFMSYEGRIKLGLYQQSYDTDTENRSVHDILQEYDLTAHLLQEKPVSLRLRARRRDDFVRDLFSDVVTFQETTFGADLLIDSRWAPTRISATHTDLDRQGIRSDSESELDTFEVSTRLMPSTRSPTDIRYLHRDFTEDFSSSTNGVDFDRTTEIQSDDLSAINTTSFGGRNRHRLTSAARYYDQTGTVDVRQERLSQRLDLRHTDRFDTDYLWSWDRVETQGQTTDTTRGEAGFHHRLYESLDTFGRVRARNTDFSEGEDEDVLGAGLRFAYRKSTLRGLLTAGYSIDVDRIDRGASNAPRFILDEGVVLTDGVTTFLAQSDVILTTVAVTDVTGLITYVEGIDYQLTEVGNLVQIERIFGGGIANGQLVLVDYQFLQEEAIDFTQLRQTAHVRHDWTEGRLRNLALYYRYGDLSNSGDTGNTELLEYTEHLFGANYRWRVIDLLAEYHIFDANTSPQETLRLGAHTSFSPWRRSQFRAGAEYNHIVFTDGDEEDTDLVNVTANLRTDLGRHTQWELESLYRHERGRNEEDAFGLGTALRWTYRKLTASLGVRYEMLERSGTERDDVIAYLEVRREF